MSVREYLGEPFYELEVYHSEPPQDAVSFVGSPRKHPYDDGKVLIIGAPGQGESAILEFRVADIVCAQDLPSPVTEAGESYPIVRVWVRRGSVGIRYEPFEVDQPLRYLDDSRKLRERVFGLRRP
ncbi:MAG: hypothetical protein JW923_03305 [Spirochaetales bacterium]|nr:hypothetical protein [Spirochaetales bacterium]MBP7263623.1 hypothetical protein [Spirochaetia bacterium]